MNPAKIVVVGSINQDIIFDLPCFPVVGETLLAQGLMYLPGGKGANQAVAAARLGGKVALIGKVGEDEYGAGLLAHLQQQGVDTTHVLTTSQAATGMACIYRVAAENSIVVHCGANDALTASDIDAQQPLVAQADVVLCQLEIPLECVAAVVRLAKRYQKPLILNPAPVQSLPAAWLDYAFLTPNQHEWRKLIQADDKEAMTTFFQRYHGVITLGKEGVMAWDTGQLVHYPAYAVKDVDSTGAGDTFNGALAVFWSLGLTAAIRHASAAAALATCQMGAQTAMPNQTELYQFIRENHV